MGRPVWEMNGQLVMVRTRRRARCRRCRCRSSDGPVGGDVPCRGACFEPSIDVEAEVEADVEADPTDVLADAPAP